MRKERETLRMVFTLQFAVKYRQGVPCGIHRQSHTKKELEKMELSWQSIKAILREVLEEEMGVGRASMSPRFEGGKLILQPQDSNLKNKEIPMEVFFKKITSVREKLRVLEQKINNNKSLSVEERAELQQAITRAYGSLTTFNILFADDEDRFVGMRGE